MSPVEASFSGEGRADTPERGAAEGSWRLLDRAVAASTGGIVITDSTRPDNPIVYVNPAFERITGYPEEEILGCNCRFLQGDDKEQPALDELRAAIREGREHRAVLRNYRKDGTLFYNELYVSPVYDDGGRLTNFIGVQNDVTERKRTEEERDLLLAREQLARAEAVTARRRFALLAAVGPELAASLDYETTLQRIPRLLVPELADWCVVDVVEEDGSTNQLVAAHADPAGEKLLGELRNYRQPAKDAWGRVSEVLRAGRPVLVSEAPDSLLVENARSEEHLRVLRELEIRSYMSVPLLARGRTLGAITLVSSHPERRYDEEDLALVESVAYRCALAVDNARLYRDQSRVARTLQRSLLPSLPEVPGMEIGAEYLPVGEENEVGGDFYDLIEAGREGESWVCVIGDARGKGAVAAAVTALVRYTVRALVLQKDEPAEILADLNEAMISQLSDYQFCTAACVRVEPGDAGVELTVARGGHPAPLVLRADGSVEEIGYPSKALGVFDDPELDEQTTRLTTGEALILYTDGVTEARSPEGALFGEERLRALLSSSTGLDAAALAERVKDAAVSHAGGVPPDDIALLVLRVPEG